MLIVIYIFEGTVDSVCSASQSLVLVGVYNLICMFHLNNVYIHFNLARYDLVSTDICNSVWAGVYN